MAADAQERGIRMKLETSLEKKQPGDRRGRQSDGGRGVGMVTFIKPWERQAGETPKAFHAFDHYLRMGVERSIDKAYRQHVAVCRAAAPDAPPRMAGRRRPSKRWEVWSADFDWTTRVAAWDAAISEQGRRDAEDVILKRRKAQADQLAMTRTALAVPSTAIMGVLSDPVRSRELQTKIARMSSLEDVVALFGLLARLATALSTVVTAERLLMGEATGRLEVEAHDVQDADALRANPEATALLNELAAVLALAPAGSLLPSHNGPPPTNKVVPDVR
jgi:hypothetical protein